MLWPASVVSHYSSSLMLESRIPSREAREAPPSRLCAQWRRRRYRQTKQSASAATQAKGRGTHDLRAVRHIYLRRTGEGGGSQSGRPTPIDSMQECLTRRLRRRIVCERPRLHSREHVRRIRLILLRRRGPSSWQRWRGETVSVPVGRLLPEPWIESGGLCREKEKLKKSVTRSTVCAV